MQRILKGRASVGLAYHAQKNASPAVHDADSRAYEKELKDGDLALLVADESFRVDKADALGWDARSTSAQAHTAARIANASKEDDA